MKIAVFAFTVLLSSAGFSMTVEDPKNNAATLNLFFPATTEKPFICNHPVTFLQKISSCDILCNKLYCRNQCQDSMVKNFQLQAENCDQSEIDIYSSLSWSLKIKSPFSLKFGQTWIQEFLESTDFFIIPSGVYRLVFVQPPETRVLVDDFGDEHEIQTVSIFLDYIQSPDSSGLPMKLILDLQRRGIDQILYFGFTVEKDYFFKRKGFL